MSPVLALVGTFCLAGAGIGGADAPSSLARVITTATLVRQMTDLQALAQFPDPAYRTTQFSSYDRRSVAPYAPEWYANSDGFGREPIPNFLAAVAEPGEDGVGTYLMAEVNGPGAIVRTWTARINGEVKVTLDGAAEPLYEGSAAEFLGQTCSVLARKAGLIEEPIDEGFRQAQACYFPIAFARSLRIEWRGRLDRVHFYQIEVRLYPAGTPIRTFSLEDLKTYGRDIGQALAVLREPYARYTLPHPGRDVPFDAAVAPGERIETEPIPGPAALQELRLTVEADDLHRALRQVIVKGYFDGAHQPQIDAPLGDLFGAGPGVNPYDTLPMTVTPEGTMICRFVMPFRESVVFAFDNLGDQTVNVTGRASVADYEWRDGASMHFHAKWRVDHGLMAGRRVDSQDIPYLCARGRGVLVGVAAMLLNPSGIPTAGGNWWGEGDEKIWIDDDTFPSLFGTGSEDYFNYAWSRPTLFDYAYCAQPLDTGPDTRGFVTNNRWHILDPLPFTSSIDFFMELMHHSATPGFTYARMAYFYASPGVRDDHVQITAANVTQGLELPENWQPVAAGGAGGATFYQAEDIVAPRANNAEVLSGRMWSAGKLLHWRPTAEGQTIDLRFNVEKAGRYQLVMTAAFAPTSGQVSAAIDGGEPMSPVADLYTPHHTMLRNIFLTPAGGGPVDLAAGQHTLTLTSRGTGEAGTGTSIGLDFVWLLPRR